MAGETACAFRLGARSGGDALPTWQAVGDTWWWRSPPSSECRFGARREKGHELSVECGGGGWGPVGIPCGVGHVLPLPLPCLRGCIYEEARFCGLITRGAMRYHSELAIRSGVVWEVCHVEQASLGGGPTCTCLSAYCFVGVELGSVANTV